MENIENTHHYPLRLFKGKFYRGDVLVPVEFGNKEQIDLLKKAEEKLKQGVDIDINFEEKVSYTIKASWECPICNHQNSERDYEEYEEFEPDDDDVEEFLQENTHCENCDSDFTLKVVQKKHSKSFKWMLDEGGKNDE